MCAIGWGYAAKASSRWTYFTPTSAAWTLSRGFKMAAAIRKDGRLAEFVKQRYSSWGSGIGAKIEAGKASLKELEAYMLKKGDSAPNSSGRQDGLGNLINEFI